MVRTFTCMLLMWCSVYGFSQQKDCTLKKNSDGIQVYTCKSETDKFKMLRAEFSIKNTTIDELVAFLKNVSNFPSWQYNMVSAEVLLQETENKIITRSEIDAPWPVNNRELIVEYSFEKNTTSDQVDIVIKTVPYHYVLGEGLVRVPFSYAEWFVVSQGGGLHVTYTMRIDPGGSVPAWMVNLAMAEGPYQSFRNLKNQLE